MARIKLAHSRSEVVVSRLIIPIGAPGCGKTYLRDRLVIDGKLDPEAAVCPDEFREWLTGHVANQKYNLSVFEVVHTICRTRLLCNLDVYLDATNLTTDSRRLYPLWQAETKCELLYVLFPFDPQKYYDQNKNRTKVVPQEVMERMIARHRQATYDVLSSEAKVVTPEMLESIL